MPTLQADNFADMTAGTLRDLGRLKIQNIAQSLQDYEIVPRWLKKGRLTFDDGYGISRNLYNAVSGNSRHVGLTDEDDVNITDLIKTLNIPWRHCDASWAVEFRSDVLMNRGASKIVDLIKLKRADAMLSMIEELENRAWGDSPTAADTLLPYSIPYWIVKASGTPSFQGGYPSDHTSVGGVNTTNSPRFKNWTGQYTANTKADLVKKMRDMHYQCGFKSPLESDLPDYRQSRSERYRVYTNRAVVSGFEDIGEAQNENLGRDIASMAGGTLAFRGHPIITVPKLDADTTNPVYFLDQNTFYAVALKGNFFRESKAPAPRQHNIVQYFVDLSYNFLNVDRRRSGVLYV